MSCPAWGEGAVAGEALERSSNPVCHSTTSEEPGLPQDARLLPKSPEGLTWLPLALAHRNARSGRNSPGSQGHLAECRPQGSRRVAPQPQLQKGGVQDSLPLPETAPPFIIQLWNFKFSFLKNPK